MVLVYRMTCTTNKHLDPLSEIGTLCNKPTSGIQIVFEIIFHSCPELPGSRGPFYIWRRVAEPALPSRLAAAGRPCRQPRERCGDERGRVRGESPEGRDGTGSLSLHTQTSRVGAYSTTGEPKWPIRARESTAFSVGLVTVCRREKQKNRSVTSWQPCGICYCGQNESEVKYGSMKN